MASAATKISFTCPNCAKVLRSSTRPPKGKKIKCPACGEAFLPEVDDEDDEATAIQSKPSVKSKAKAPPRDEDDEEDVKPRSKKKRADVEDEDDDGPPRRKSRRDDDDDEDARSIKKRKAKKKSGGMMLMVLGVVFLGGGALLSCGLCGVGAFVWPGFMMPKADLEAFVPADADLVMGGNPKLMKAKFANIDKVLRDQGPMRQRKQEFEDVTFNSERMLSFARTKDADKKDVMIFVSNASDIAKVKRNQNLGPGQTLGGHANVHKVTDEGVRNGMGSYVAFPGGNIVIVSHQAEPDLIAMLARGKQKAQPNAALELGKAVNKSAFWIAMTPDGDAKRSMKQGLEKLGGIPILPMPTLRNAATAVDGIKGFTFAFEFDDKQDVELSIKAFCKDAGDAKLFKTGLEDAWTVLHAGIQLAGFMKQPGMPEIPATLKDDMGTMKFSLEGNNALAKMKIGTKTIEDLAKLGAQQNNFAGPVPGPGPIPQPGPGPLPKDPNPIPGPGPAKMQTFTVTNLPPKLREDHTFTFQQGSRVNISMVSTVSSPKTDADLYVLQGNVGENVIAADTSVGPNGNVNFIVPVTGLYRVRVVNLGPGRVTRSTVTINEQ